MGAGVLASLIGFLGDFDLAEEPFEPERPLLSGDEILELSVPPGPGVRPPARPGR